MIIIIIIIIIINLSPFVTVRDGTYRLTVGCDGGSPSPFFLWNTSRCA